MARVTVEDCLLRIPNRFLLTLVASKRARQLASGSSALIDDAAREKPTVIALREIADGKVDPSIIKNRSQG